jgi:hypothetical protein
MMERRFFTFVSCSVLAMLSGAAVAVAALALAGAPGQASPVHATVTVAIVDCVPIQAASGTLQAVDVRYWHDAPAFVSIRCDARVFRSGFETESPG